MTGLKGYDEWKTTPPNEIWDGEPEEFRCNDCRVTIDRDSLVEIDGEDSQCPQCGGTDLEYPKCNVCGHTMRVSQEFCSRRCSKAANSPYY